MRTNLNLTLTDSDGTIIDTPSFLVWEVTWSDLPDDPEHTYLFHSEEQAVECGKHEHPTQGIIKERTVW